MEYSFLKTIYDAMNEGLYVFNMQGKITHANRACEEILGFSNEELIGATGHFLFHAHKDDTGLLECDVYKAFLAGKAFQKEDVFITKTGKKIDVYLSATPLFEEGVMTSYAVLFHDITEKKRLERERDAFYSIVENTDDIIVIKDLNLRVIATNNAFVKASGRNSVDELVGKTDAEIFDVSEETQPIKGYMRDERYAQTLPPGQSLLKEEVVIYPTGQKRVFKTRKFPIYKEGKVFATANISMDITEEKDYLEKLEQKITQEIAHRMENENFYGKIFQTANLGICLTDKEGRFVAVNPAYCKIYGYSEAELIGQPFTMVVPEDKRALLETLHREFIEKKGIEVGAEWEVVRKDGHTITIYATAGILENIVGGPYKITTISDISELIEARKLQKQQEALLIQQSKLAAMGEMLGHIAHQWRQPLNVINCTCLDIGLKKEMGVLNNAMLSESLLSIENVTDQMSQTINDFMDFYKPNKTRSRFLVHEVVWSAHKIIDAQLKNNKIQFNVHMDENLELFGPFGELQQVMLNLFSNAKDAFAKGVKKEKKLCVVARRTGDEVIVCVEDNAGGIDEAMHEKIFEPYITTKSETGGTGIGLYMCMMIMSGSFGGSIKVENIFSDEECIGARFVLKFPLRGMV